MHHTIDHCWWAQFGPMLKAFLTTTHHPHQKPWHTTHTNNEYHRPNASLMHKRASQPPCPLGILASADLQWKQSASPTRRTFFGNSYTAPTPSLHTLQLLGLSISKAYSTLLCNATCMFQLHTTPTAPAFDLYKLSSLWKIRTIPRSIGHAAHNSASLVELRLRVG